VKGRGNADEKGVMKRFAEGACRGLDCEYAIEAPEDYAGRKIFKPMVLEGTTDGHAKAVDISRKMLRAIIDSKHGLKHNDESAAARAKREVNSLSEFDGVRIMFRVGVEPPKGAVIRLRTPFVRSSRLICKNGVSCPKIEQISRQVQVALALHLQPMAALLSDQRGRCDGRDLSSRGSVATTGNRRGHQSSSGSHWPRARHPRKDARGDADRC
jgi:hypothetical protein